MIISKFEAIPCHTFIFVAFCEKKKADIDDPEICLNCPDFISIDRDNQEIYCNEN